MASHQAVNQKGITFKRIDPAREIRLLEIQPARNIPDGLECRHVPVTVRPDMDEYVGLSALCGETSQLEQIQINGTRIGIPVTLAQALRHVRAVFATGTRPSVDSDSASSKSQTQPQSHSQRPKPLPLPPRRRPAWLAALFGNSSRSSDDREPPTRVWFDALCIDSSNPRERSNRRSHMHLAYSNAVTVVGWLGLPDETSDLAIEMLEVVDRAMPLDFGTKQHRIDHPEHYAPQYKWMAGLQPIWDDLDKYIHDPANAAGVVASRNFLNRPYFLREWILNEIAMARFPAFLLGDKIVSWRMVLRSIRCNEEIIDNGASYVPEKYHPFIEYLPLGSVLAFLKEYERTQLLEEAKKRELCQKLSHKT